MCCPEGPAKSSVTGLWMENRTLLAPLKQPVVLELVGFYVPPGSGPLFFLVALLTYLLTLLTNGVVAVAVILDRSLHRPMFIMICHLVGCDLLGATGMLPPLMVHFMTGNRKLSHALAIIQALCIHTYGASIQTILAVMAYDRYVAVCEPLRYPTIMTSTRLHICCSLAWLVSLLSISVLFFFHIDIQLCGNVIKDVYSNNRVILALACSPTPINNIYGLTLTWTLSTSVFLVIAFSYARILHAGIRRDRTGFTVNTKAFRTCATHLVVYVFYRISALILIVAYRFPSLPLTVKKFCSILFIVVPPAINPVIYGLISRELRTSIIRQLSTTTQKLSLVSISCKSASIQVFKRHH